LESVAKIGQIEPKIDPCILRFGVKWIEQAFSELLSNYFMVGKYFTNIEQSCTTD